MNDRIIRIRDESGSSVRKDIKPAVWAVLSENYRDELFTGTYEECVQYLKGQCANGSCEE